MEASPSFLSCVPAHDNGEGKGEESAAVAQVDPFLVEALENPRHRLTVLRMELDIQRFMQNSELLQFEFQHFPTSYLRCAAHRVAQHYGLQTLALDNVVDGSGSRVLARKTPESKYPAICLSDIPIKQPESEKTEQVKIVLRPRLNRASLNDGMEPGTEKNPVRSVEERKEEYDKARARIFSGSSSPELVDGYSSTSDEGRSLCLNGDEQECYDRNVIEEHEKLGAKDGASRVAIFRDREKDRIDPDYDRSYERYAKGFLPCHDFSLGVCSVLQPSFMQYEPGFALLSRLPRTQTAGSYRPSDPVMNPFSAVGCNQNSPSAVYMHWPTPAMMYAHSYEHLRGAVYQAPVYQQPLSFEHWQNR